MITKIYLILCVCLFSYLIWKRRKFYLLTLKIRGPLGYPLIGMAHRLRKREVILAGLKEFEENYGYFFYSWLGPTPVVVVVEPHLLEEILKSPHCVNKGIMYDAIRDSSGDGLFVLHQPEWYRHRKLMSPGFSNKILQNSFSIFDEESEKLIKIFGEYCGREKIAVLGIFQEYAVSLATMTTMGYPVDEYIEAERLVDGYAFCLATATDIIFSPWLMFTVMRMIFGCHWRYESSKDDIQKFIRTLVDKRISHVETESSNNKDTLEINNMLDLTVNLHKKGNFTYKNVVDESVTIYIGAFETTSSTIANALMLLAMFPEYQQKLFEEILSFYPDKANMVVTVQDIQQMTYLEMVVNEVLRVMPAVPLIARSVSSDFQLSNGITLPKGLQIAIDIFNLHRRVDIWGSDAHLFNPENFQPGKMEAKHSYAYIPFAKGMRSCIGWRYAMLSTKIVLVKLLRNFHFKTDFKFEDLVFVEGITLKLKEAPLLAVSRRVVT